MKSTISASIFALSMLMLAGCSSMQDKSTMTMAQPVSPAQDYMARVEQRALDRGVDVHWVNPPQQPVNSDL